MLLRRSNSASRAWVEVVATGFEEFICLNCVEVKLLDVAFVTVDNARGACLLRILGQSDMMFEFLSVMFSR